MWSVGPPFSFNISSLWIFHIPNIWQKFIIIVYMSDKIIFRIFVNVWRYLSINLNTKFYQCWYHCVEGVYTTIVMAQTQPWHEVMLYNAADQSVKATPSALHCQHLQILPLWLIDSFSQTLTKILKLFCESCITYNNYECL